MPVGVEFFDYDECAWKDMRLFFGGVEVGKVTGVRYGVEPDDEELFAAGDESIGIQSGNIKKSGMVKMLKGAAEDANRAVMAAGGRWLPDAQVDIVVVYQTDGTRPLQTDVIGKCKLGKFEKGWNQGDKKMEIEIPFLFRTLTTS